MDNNTLSEEFQQKIRESDYKIGKKTIVYYKDEQFKPYPKNENYLIGNYGTNYSIQAHRKLIPHKDDDGFDRYYLGKDYRVHRAILETFNPVENSDKLKVIHTDGNKDITIYDPVHNRTNLAWCTAKESMANSSNIGHRFQSGENHHKAKYKENEIYEICQYLSEGLTGRQIAEKIGKEYTVQFQDLISKIKTKRSWKNISDTFDNLKPKCK